MQQPRRIRASKTPQIARDVLDKEPTTEDEEQQRKRQEDMKYEGEEEEEEEGEDPSGKFLAPVGDGDGDGGGREEPSIKYEKIATQQQASQGQRRYDARQQQQHQQQQHESQTQQGGGSGGLSLSVGHRRPWDMDGAATPPVTPPVSTGAAAAAAASAAGGLVPVDAKSFESQAGEMIAGAATAAADSASFDKDDDDAPARAPTLAGARGEGSSVMGPEEREEYADGLRSLSFVAEGASRMQQRQQIHSEGGIVVEEGIALRRPPSLEAEEGEGGGLGMGLGLRLGAEAMSSPPPRADKPSRGGQLWSPRCVMFCCCVSVRFSVLPFFWGGK